MISRMKKRLQGGFTLIELMIVVAIIGILAAVAIPQFMKYMKKSKTTEAVNGVKKIYDGAKTYYGESDSLVTQAGLTVPRQFPAAVSGRTPATACCANGGKCNPEVSQWTNPSWVALKFSIDDPHYYQYSYTSAGTGAAAVFTASANGDLDCDNNESTFEAQGSVNTEGEITGSNSVYRVNDIE